MTKEQKSIDPLLNIKSVLEQVSLSKASLYAMIKDGTFPRPLKLSKRSVRWKQSTITAFIDSLKEA